MKTRTGYLIKRPSGYYCRLVIDGRVYIRALYNTDGTFPKNRTDARKAQAEFIKKFIASGNPKGAYGSIKNTLSDTHNDIDTSTSQMPTIKGAWNSYLKSPARLTSGEHTLRLYERYCRKFTQWVKSHYPKVVYLSEVTRIMAGEYALDLTQQNYSNSSFNKHTFFIRLLFRVLCEDQPNPFTKVRNKPANSVPHRPLTPEQLSKVLGATKGELHTLLLIGTYTALRLKDACNLRWDEMDMDNNTLTVTTVRLNSSRSPDQPRKHWVKSMS